MPGLVDTNILLQARLRHILDTVIGTVWAALPGYDRANVDQWLTNVLPVVAAAQRQSVALTDAYLSRALDRPPIGIIAEELIGAAVRNGTPPETVYTRPFIQLWSALGDGTPYSDAVAQGLHRATSTAAMDVQLSHRATYAAAQNLDPTIRGYRRVADSNACAFCVTVDGAFVKNAAAMPLHNHCGCGLAPVTQDVEATPAPDTVAVHEHGELGLVLAAPGQHFQTLADFA